MAAPVIDIVTFTSLGAAASLLVIAYLLSLRVLPSQSSTRTRILFIWHLFDSLTHFLFEGSFLYNCFTVFLPISEVKLKLGVEPFIVTPPGVYFLGQKDRLYGSAYGTGPTSLLWQEYAKADKRWGGADLTVIALEILTVCIGGPLAAYIGYLLAKGHGDVAAANGKTKLSGKIAFWIIVLATGELYGGFMTFAPEWLTGGPNLDTSNFMYLWVYLVFFNMLWVFFPIWALVESFGSITGTDPVAKAKGAVQGKKSN